MLTEKDYKIIAQLSYEEALRRFNEAIRNISTAFRGDLQSYLNVIMIINRN